MFCLQGVGGEKERRRWERFIVAYDGELREDETSADVTHLVYKEVPVSYYGEVSLFDITLKPVLYLCEVAKVPAD